MEDLTKNSVSVTQSQSIDASGKLHRTVNVQYKLGSHGPFTIQLPVESFSSMVVNAEIERMRQQLQGVIA